MPSFEDIGLHDELLHALEDADLEIPTALQEAVIPPLRRGGNLVARASSGSGKTLAYGLGVLDRLGPGETAEEEAVGLRALVLVPTVQEAEHVARSLASYASALAVPVAALGAGWATSAAEARLLIATATDLMQSVRSSGVKLDEVESLVIDNAAAIVQLGQWDEVDAIIDLIPRQAQRVVFSASFPEPVEDLIERRVKRALRYPAEAAVSDARTTPQLEGEVGVVLVPQREKLGLLAAQLTSREEGTPAPILYCRNDEAAAELAEALALRGFLVGGPDDEDADVVIALGGVPGEHLEPSTTERPQTISYDAPADARSLRARHLGDPDAIVLVEPRQLEHVREIARQASFRARPAPLAPDLAPSRRELERFRNEVRRTIREKDLSAQLLVLEPLFEEFAPMEIAAATAALLRSRRPAPAAEQAPEAAPAPRVAEQRGAPAGPAPATWARLYVGIGSRDEIRPGDLVGALAGEANIPGSRIGKIEIRDSFSIVEVQADVADQVIRAVNGTTVKGRAVRVDYDRGGPERRPPTRGRSTTATPRRTVRRPPREE